VSSYSRAVSPAVPSCDRSSLAAAAATPAAPFKAEDGKFHGWFNQLPDQCGLSSWLPGSYIEHGIADHPLGPFELAPGSGTASKSPPPPGAPRNPLDQYATNPHVTYVASEKTWLLYFNGRRWAPNDLTSCEPNRTGAAPWHGGGRSVYCFMRRAAAVAEISLRFCSFHRRFVS
jgi:hypothetical protein